MTSTHQQSLADAGSDNHPPMSKRGSYVPWESRFMSYIDRKKDTRKLLKRSVEVGPYKFKKIAATATTDAKTETKDDLAGDDLKHYEQYEGIVNAPRAKRTAKTHDLLALVVHTYAREEICEDQEDNLTTAMMLLARAITQLYSTPTNNRLRTSLNTRNQIVVLANRVDI
uniref:Uncharacterized protein n=1 Tax=Tanacetum cinerariifolium TaxID=118510 RepID=A0A6L2L7B5_TANCI|nr:hypothetical protein [Tanacetum cinerariifolium]